MAKSKTITLNEIATSRSGDKGNHANLGVVAFTKAGYDYLLAELTAARVKQYFKGLQLDEVTRYELPKVWALNFVLTNALAGGASESLRIDTQGKLLGTALSELTLPAPAELKTMIKS